MDPLDIDAQKPKRGRPRKAFDPDASGSAPKTKPRDRKPKRKRLRAPTKEVEERWAKGEALKEGARAALGVAAAAVRQVLRRGEVIGGIRPEVALDKALSPAMLRVAGYEDKQAPGVGVQLVQLLMPAPGVLNPTSAALLDAVRALDSHTLPSAPLDAEVLGASSSITQCVTSADGDDAVRHDSPPPVESAKVGE